MQQIDFHPFKQEDKKQKHKFTPFDDSEVQISQSSYVSKGSVDPKFEVIEEHSPEVHRFEQQTQQKDRDNIMN